MNQITVHKMVTRHSSFVSRYLQYLVMMFDSQLNSEYSVYLMDSGKMYLMDSGKGFLYPLESQNCFGML